MRYSSRYYRDVAGVLAACLCATWLLSAPASARQNVIPESAQKVMDRYVEAYNRQDFVAMYRDMSTSRLRSSRDFAAYRALMQEIFQRLGPGLSHEMTCLIEDEYHTQFDFYFYRAQYQVRYQKGQAVERIVLVQDKDTWQIDGHAILVDDEVLFAQGNLYNFDAVDMVEDSMAAHPQLAAPFLWYSGYLKDSRTEYLADLSGEKEKKEAFERRRNFLDLARKGKFEEARRHLPEDESIDQYLDAVDAGRIQPEAAMAMYDCMYAFQVEEDPVRARALGEKAIKLMPREIGAESYMFLAMMQMSDDEDIPSAIEMVRRGLSLNPGDGDLERVLKWLEMLEQKVLHGEFDEPSQQELESAWGKPVYPGDYSGPVERRHSNGQVAYMAQVTNGILEGPYTAYSPDGVLVLEGSYVNGVQDGLQRQYNKQGTMVRMRVFDQGRQVQDRHYDDTGRLRYRFELVLIK